MPVMNVWYYLNGYIIISIRGKRRERLINLAINLGILLRDIRCHKETAFMKVDIEGFKRLRPLARKTRCRIKIKKKVGFPFFIYRLSLQKGLMAGAFFFFFALYIFSSFIWFVEVSGTEKIDPDDVLEISRELGLQPGVFKENLEPEKISRDLAIRIPDLSWAGVEILGTRARIQVVEKVKELETREGIISHIVASRDGLILELLTISGQVEVSPGETVEEGQILIRGIISDEEEEEEEREEMYVRARGNVKARVWYEGYGSSTLLVKKAVPSGKQEEGFFVKGWGRVIYSSGVIDNPYEYYKMESTRRNVRWRNLGIPVELVSLRFKELIPVKEELTPEEALERAKNEAREDAMNQVSDQADPVKKYYEILDTGDEQFFEVRFVIESIEDIGLEKRFDPDRGA